MDRGYSLDLLTPARHAATEIERAAPAALSVSEIAATYRHPAPADLGRVRNDHGARNDDEATRWLIEEALKGLMRRGATGSPQLIHNGDGYRFADGVTFDDLRYNKRKLVRESNIHQELGDPFNKQSGEFSDNVGIASKRMDSRHGSLDDLRDSLRRYGWRKELPGVRDENGIIIIGHRRWAVADELDIPVSERPMMTVTYGEGDEADRNRIIAAVASQVGYKEFTETEWKRVARYLRAQGETIQAIAEVLGKPITTVHDTVRDFAEPVKSKGRGRPRKMTDEQQRDLAHKYFEEGKPIHIAEAEARGWDEPKARPTAGAIKTIDQERGRRQERELVGNPPRSDDPEHKCCCPACGNVHPR